MKLTSRFDDAFEFASKIHREDTKKNTEVPYIAHLLEVSSLVLSYGGNEDEAIAALLHDSVEDHSDVVKFETIGKRFGGRVAAIVESCSDTSVFPKPPWCERKKKYIAHVRHANESVVTVSAADKLANARAILKDYRQVGEELWQRFNADKAHQLWYYREVTAALTEAAGEGRARPLVEELQRAAAELQSVCGGTSKPA